jgi:hypothetical protein
MTEKITSILKTFSSDDVKDFKKFLASPFFQKGRNLTPYFNTLLKFKSGFNFDKEKIIRLYFGTLGSNEKNASMLRTLNSDLSRALDDYLAACAFKEINFYKNYLLIEEYTSRKLYELGESKAEEIMAEKDNFDTGHIRELQMLLLMNAYSNCKGLLNKNAEMYAASERQSEELITLIFNLSSFLMNSLTVNKLIYNIKKNTEQLSPFLKNFNFEEFAKSLRHDFPNYKKIKLDMALICINISDKDTDNLHKYLSDLYMDAFDTLDTSDKMNFFLSIHNYYTKHEKEEMFNMKLELIKFALSKGLFPSGEVKYLGNGNLKMFMLAALYAKDIEWAESFLKEYIEKINPDFKENMRHYTSAYISHYKGEYTKSLEEISLYKFQNESFTFDMKLMQLKNYYGLAKQSESYLENLNYSLDSFTHFISDNKKVSEAYRIKGKGFIKDMRLLMKCAFDNHIFKNKDDIKFEMEKLYSATKNFWIKDQAKELTKLR